MKKILVLLVILYSCSDAHQAQRGLKKFYRNGGKFECDTTMTILSDTIKINGKDSIIYRTFNTVCPEFKAPKTRFEVRNERKSKEDSLKYALKTLKERNNFTIDSLSKVIKLAKINVKNNRIDSREVIRLTKQQMKNETKNRFWIGFFIGVVASMLCYILAKRLFS